MDKKNKIYIFGHKKPDTDSITSAIALAHLKNELGYNAEARILGSPNNETKYVLQKFNIKMPRYLDDVKTKIRDLDFLKNYSAKMTDSMYHGFEYMNEYDIGTLPIVDEENNFVGMVSLKDIAKQQVSGDITRLCTSYNNILNTINSEEILRFEDEICGIITVASYRSATFIDTVNLNENSILIIGDRYSIIEYAIERKVKLIIITGNKYISPEIIEKAKANRVSIISSKENTFLTSRKIGMTNYLSTVLCKDEIISIDYYNDINDFIDISKRYKYSNYPVLKDNKTYIGLVRLSDITSPTKKQVILVDHNEESQSVDGLDEAEVIEIIDHHKIGTMATNIPINFRNMPVGSTNTIVALLYKEHNIEIPQNIAGLMLSGIISDTLLFKSPTTTQLDKQISLELAKIANIDIQTYGMNMLKAGSSLKGKTKEEILYMDFKNFTINDKKVGIGQITTLNINEIMDEKEEYIKLINEVAENNDYYIVGLFATDLIENGSYVFYNDSAKDVLDNCFGLDEIHQGFYLDGCISRKKQIIPNIMNELEKK